MGRVWEYLRENVGELFGSDFRREAHIVGVENSLSEEANSTFGTREVVVTTIG